MPLPGTAFAVAAAEAHTTTGGILGSLLVIVILGAALSLVVRGRAHPFSTRLGSVRVRSITGQNWGLLMGTLEIARLVRDAGDSGQPSLPIATFLIGAAVFLVVGLIVSERFTAAVVGLGGLGAFLITDLFSHGADSAFGLAVLLFGLWVLLAVARGLLG